MNKLTIYTETVIDGAHFLKGYDGKCKNLHGHSWLLKVWIKGTPIDRDSVGIIYDFTKIKKIKEMFDHKLINEVVSFNPTAENLVMYIHEKLKDDRPELKYKVRLYETAVGKETYVEISDWEERIE